MSLPGSIPVAAEWEQIMGLGCGYSRPTPVWREQQSS